MGFAKGAYYRSVRTGNTVRRVYVGSGVRALEAAHVDAIARAKSQAGRERERARLEALKAESADLASWFAAGEAAISAALRAHGWHRVQRTWRKRRVTVDALTKASGPDTWVTENLWKQVEPLANDVSERAARCEPSALRAVDQFLANPAGRALYGDMSRQILERWSRTLAQGNVVVQKAIVLQAADLRAQLAGPNPTALDLLLCERVVQAKLFAESAELMFAANIGHMSAQEVMIYVKRIESAGRLLLAACRTLAKVRRVKLPDVVAVVHASTLGTPKAPQLPIVVQPQEQGAPDEESQKEGKGAAGRRPRSRLRAASH